MLFLHFLICCLFAAFPKIPLQVASLEYLPERLPTGLMLIGLSVYSPCLLFAAVALISLSAPISGSRTRLIISGVFFLLSVILTRVLSAAAVYMGSRSGTEYIALMQIINAAVGFFSIINTAGMIILFCALSIDTYEYTRNKGIPGA